MKNKSYSVIKTNNNGELTIELIEKINGYKFKPKNKINYRNLRVKSMIIVKPSFIENVLKKKIKIKLEFYLNYIMNLLNDDDSDDNFRESLDELERFKETVEYKYRKYLDDKYINLLQKKITLIEHEIKNKMKNRIKKEKNRVEISEYEEEIVEERHRRR